MQRSRPDLRRLTELAAIGLAVAMPVALIVATWGPLEPPPREGRAGSVEREGADEAVDAAEEDVDRGRPRERRAQASPTSASQPAEAVATP